MQKLPPSDCYLSLKYHVKGELLPLKTAETDIVLITQKRPVTDTHTNIAPVHITSV